MYLKFRDVNVSAQDVIVDDCNDMLVFARAIASPEEARAIAYYVKNKRGFVDTQPYIGFARLEAAKTHIVSCAVQGIAYRLVTIHTAHWSDYFFLARKDADVGAELRRFLHTATPYPVPAHIRPDALETHGRRLEIHAPGGIAAAYALSDQNIRTLLEEATS
jgi:hypothetical protein